MENLGTIMSDILKRVEKERGITVDLENIDMEERRKQDEIRITKKYKAQEKYRMFNSSLVSDPDDLKSTFDDFLTDTPEQEEELSQAQNIANKIYKGDTSNYLFTGKAGRGKTMLAVSILNGLKSLDTDITCLFVSVEMLVNLERQAVVDKFNIEKNDVYRLEKCIEKCDVLVLDDLGSETSFVTGSDIQPATRFTQEVLFRIADYRKNKANIITTNNAGGELQRMYHGKIVSRLLTRKPENVIVFGGQDMREV
ncbi:ATP-binding protein [Companilactobacillus sp.]|jgi:DNA replication protein DnaC|uniref:ATP-binding protein n=1 Tax=Companilactobacillus sp. TaxID=2767905 RepID=UPI0025C1CCED|nr:ATP-binding protein [Companilactobacillus sp.]MCH4008120.1 ATP-binding protein [Companilactobacillus sp.]MCH4051701.1 ATP-binding protein [Companilactobacillus sp.]MCH4076063.1 ATP-binding protein [Companilactobacillus sp.]MCH4124638.1 ATP-binding protein [Companilactobacillus sp.]MCH4132399.1 ATP-binding protein [Companilactobacillus sp.]